MLARAAKAFLLHVGSLSTPRKVAIRSAASGIRDGEWEWMEATAKTAFLRT